MSRREPRTYRVTCTYMGETAVYEERTARELLDPWLFYNVDEDLSTVDKMDGSFFVTGDDRSSDPHLFEPGGNPRRWKRWRSTERMCGPWWHMDQRLSKDEDLWREAVQGVLKLCNDNLVSVGMEPLLVITDEAGEVDIWATFEAGGPNADAVEALDYAHWRLEREPGRRAQRVSPRARSDQRRRGR